jgi:nucleotide-binding universal stress UspA family protein
MRVVTWIVADTWAACVDATRSHAPDDAEIVLLHVDDPDVVEIAHGAFAGMMGRGRPERDPGTRMESAGAASARELLEAAAARLDRPCAVLELSGRVEREVVAVAAGADLLVVARGGDPTRPGPHSIGHEARYVVDHAPCAVLLVWPQP